jgi:hypothetical protein
MKKLDIKKEEVQYLKRNWNSLTESTRSVLNETMDFVMASVEKDLEMVLDRTNKAVVGANKWLKSQQTRIHASYLKKEEEIEKQIEMSRMDDEGGAGFINTLPHETSPTETSNASDHHH